MSCSTCEGRGVVCLGLRDIGEVQVPCQACMPNTSPYRTLGRDGVDVWSSIGVDPSQLSDRTKAFLSEAASPEEGQEVTDGDTEQLVQALSAATQWAKYYHSWGETVPRPILLGLCRSALRYLLKS